MITVIYGEKGTGKTKQMVESANGSLKSAKGCVVYIDKDSNRIHDLERAIRLVDASHYGICCQACMLAFIKGMLAVNFDIVKIYIDGLAKIVSSDINDMEIVYTGLEKIAEEYGLEIVITASCAKENLPAFVAKFVK